MRFPWLTFILFLALPFLTHAQSGAVTGMVTDSGTNKPVARASVFLSNSSVGTATGDDGKFTLNGIRYGQYTLVVSILGYKEFEKTILVGKNPLTVNIKLAPKPIALREVVISSPADWKKNFEAFKKDFIGVDENAKYCEIMNPHILNLTYNSTKEILHADADDFLVVENKALGYRIKFLLTDFTADRINGIVSFNGQRLFEDLPGSQSQKRKWHEKREEVYYGSAMHFYRALYQDKLDSAGFVVYRLRRYLNPERPKEEVIRRELKINRMRQNRDSMIYWLNIEAMSKYYNESLVKPPLKQFEMLSRTEQQGIFMLHFTDYLYVIYTKKRDPVDYKDLYRPLEMPNYEISVIDLMDGFPLFDMNGIVVANSPLYEGTWSKSRLSDMLPVDYVPDQK